ncbi:hypothetical protein RUM43_004843 [Polyplax serrata]|uniref:Uncharacterized protein n=1 Tax=Polyplax serrata TaxID=468196 RepID=A0AAN8SB96_POLSC
MGVLGVYQTTLLIILAREFGVSLTSQRCQTRHEDIKMSLAADSPPSVLHQRVHSPASLNVSPAMGAAVYSGGIVYNDRPPSIWPSQPHNPGLWQYSGR